MIDIDRINAVTARSQTSCDEAGFGDTRTPLVDAWYVEHSDRRGSAHVDILFPSKLWVKIEEGAAPQLACMTIEDVTIRDYPENVRLMLMAALEWLDQIERDRQP